MPIFVQQSVSSRIRGMRHFILFSSFLPLVLTLNLTTEPPKVGLCSTLPYLLGIIGAGPNFDPTRFIPTIAKTPINSIIRLLYPNSTGTEAEKVKFYCANRKNPTPTQVYVGKPLKSFKFNKRLPTYILIHGYTDGYSTPQGLLKLGQKSLLKHTNSNVCVVDWRDWAAFDYITTTTVFVTKVGDYLAKFLKHLERRHGLDYNNVNLVGHSLGAHICGWAGKKLKGQVGNITGIEPAGPLFCPPFQLLPNSNRLSQTDAKYVQTILTTPGFVSCHFPLGHQNFYANLGIISQPACTAFNPLCSHYEANYDWLSSIDPRKKFVGVKCKDQLSATLDDIISTCDYSDTGTDVMGIWAQGKEGNFFFRTTNSYLPEPYFPGSPILPIKL